MAKQKWWPKPHLLKLKPFIATVNRGDLLSDGPLLSCVRASIVKAYEFSEFSYIRMRAEFAFHCLGSLRSICEDLIILKFISRLSPNDQASLLLANIQMTTDNSLKRQLPFFKLFRPGQPILGGHPDKDLISKMNVELARIWQSHGWPRKKDGKFPPTEQIAQKVGVGTLEVIYNYMYRLTSSTVHFSAGALMRTGWGNDEQRMVYSTAHMGRYYLQFCQIYSVFLLSIYFEFFGDLLGADMEVRDQVKSLRNVLVMYPRWPEMITFEEMNKDLPDYQLKGLSAAIQRVMADEIDDGFIAATEKKKGPKS